MNEATFMVDVSLWCPFTSCAWDSLGRLRLCISENASVNCYSSQTSGSFRTFFQCFWWHLMTSSPFCQPQTNPTGPRLRLPSSIHRGQRKWREGLSPDMGLSQGVFENKDSPQLYTDIASYGHVNRDNVWEWWQKPDVTGGFRGTTFSHKPNIDDSRDDPAWITFKALWSDHL